MDTPTVLSTCGLLYCLANGRHMLQGYKDTRIFIQTPGLHVDIWIKLTYLQNGIYITILKIILEIILKIIIIIMIISSNNNNSTNNNDNDNNNDNKK